MCDDNLITVSNLFYEIKFSQFLHLIFNNHYHVISYNFLLNWYICVDCLKPGAIGLFWDGTKDQCNSQFSVQFGEKGFCFFPVLWNLDPLQTSYYWDMNYKTFIDLSELNTFFSFNCLIFACIFKAWNRLLLILKANFYYPTFMSKILKMWLCSELNLSFSSQYGKL